MTTLMGEKVKTSLGHAIKADANGDLPERIELLKAGVWRTPYHGDFMITLDDLQEYIDNFVAGVGLADGGSAGAPIDFSHESGKLAAGWIKKLEIVEDTLYGYVTWSKAGREAILNDEYKFFSPEFSPKGRGGWMDPEDYEHCVDNVLVGGGLTNIPLFKALGAIKASAGGKQEVRTNVTYINASELEIKELPMNVKDLVDKKADELNEEQKQFLADHQSELTDEQQVAFGFKSELGQAVDQAIENKKTEETTVETTAAVVADPEAAAVQASIKSGESVVIKASTLSEMQATIKASAEQLTAMRQERVAASVDEHIARGAIKADTKDKWVSRIMADATMAEDLTNLPSNTLLASEIGDAKGGDATNAQDELKSAIAAKIKASTEAGKPMTITEATIAVANENADLANRASRGQ